MLISCVIILRPSSPTNFRTSPGTSSPQVHYITTSCSLKFHYLVTHALKMLLLGLVCGSFHFVPQSSVVLPSFFVVYTLPFPSYIYSSSCVIHGFLAFLSTFPTKSLTVSNIHFWILSHSTSTFPLSHLIPPSFSFGVLALSVAQHVTSPDPILVYPFGTLWLHWILCNQ